MAESSSSIVVEEEGEETLSPPAHPGQGNPFPTHPPPEIRPEGMLQAPFKKMFSLRSRIRALPHGAGRLFKK